MNPFQTQNFSRCGCAHPPTMVGLMGIDWAYGFSEHEYGQKIGGSQFHFVLGQEF